MSSPISRRSFLSTSAATSAAAAFSAPLVAQQGAEPLKQVVVGVMGMGRGKSLAITFASQPGVIVKYACDIDRKRAEAGRGQIEKAAEQSPQAITDFRRILDDPEIDALVCAAPNHWHAPATIMGCAAGKHVYVEKPCSHNPWEGETMVAAARKHHKAVQMGSQRRSSPTYIAAISLLHEGAIGNVYCARSWYNNLRPTIGVGKPAPVPENLDYELWQGPAPRVPYYDNRIHYNWHWLWHWGNGELGNNGVHSLDVCRWGLGVDYPIKVTSSGGRYRYEDDQQTPDTHVATFEFPGGKQATWQGLSCNKHRDSSGFVTFYGSNGSMEVDASGSYRVYDLNDKLVTEEKGVYRDADHIGNFVTAIRNETPLELNAEIEIGHKSTMLCHLGNIAYRTGRALNVSPETGHILGDEKAMRLWKREYEPGWEPTY